MLRPARSRPPRLQLAVRLPPKLQFDRLRPRLPRRPWLRPARLRFQPLWPGPSWLRSRFNRPRQRPNQLRPPRLRPNARSSGESGFPNWMMRKAMFTCRKLTGQPRRRNGSGPPAREPVQRLKARKGRKIGRHSSPQSSCAGHPPSPGHGGQGGYGWYAGDASSAAIRRIKSFSSFMRGGLPTTASTAGGFAFIFHERAPAGHHDDGRPRGFGLDHFGHALAINIRHAQIGDDHFVRPVFHRGRAEQFQSVSSAGGHHHPMLEVRETLSHEFPDLLVVVNAKDVHGALLLEWGRTRRPGASISMPPAWHGVRSGMADPFISKY